MMIKKISLDMLTSDSVSVVTKRLVEVDGKMEQVGRDHRKAFVNSESGRDTIAAELQEPFLSAVMAMWGAAPTVPGPVAGE